MCKCMLVVAVIVSSVNTFHRKFKRHFVCRLNRTFIVLTAIFTCCKDSCYNKQQQEHFQNKKI